VVKTQYKNEAHNIKVQMEIKILRLNLPKKILVGTHTIKDQGVAMRHSGARGFPLTLQR
jgi:hypothetical protein